MIKSFNFIYEQAQDGRLMFQFDSFIELCIEQKVQKDIENEDNPIVENSERYSTSMHNSLYSNHN